MDLLTLVAGAIALFDGLGEALLALGSALAWPFHRAAWACFALAERFTRGRW